MFLCSWDIPGKAEVGRMEPKRDGGGSSIGRSDRTTKEFSGNRNRRIVGLKKIKFKRWVNRDGQRRRK